MTDAVVTDTVVTGAADRLTKVLKLSDDGYILLGEGQVIVEMNDEAGRMFGVACSELVGKPLEDAAVKSKAWDRLCSACREGSRNDLYLSLANGRRVLASLRRKPHAQTIELIKLCDLEIFDYRRQIALGQESETGSGHMSNNRTRPDFEVQRTLAPELHKVLSRGERAIQQGARILITGASGVGKSEIARYLHSGVARASDPFVSVNCAIASPADLASVLFGDEANKDGAIFRAAGGTLFLDEVAEIPPSVQARLVGYFEDSILTAPNKHASIATGPRVITATNRDLQQLVREGKFRPDLYYRIAVVGLAIPALREMPALIAHLTDRFLLTLNQRRKTPVVLPERFREVLDDYSFPGNIRELLNIVQRAAIFMEDAADMEELVCELLTSGQILPEADLPEPTTLDLKTEVRRFERALIDKAIRMHGSKRKAAAALGVDIGTVSRKTTDGP